ncbi:DUF4489 domain-containing protein [Vallitalea pronyensis]|uniref:DUF4489 domain-containing protein n=1 Tax=Vallitalea pronyensis TaxID=1348613 RepID=A0A8J8SJ94_9FIRM|nr:DUF4489 domain-containing protein [Vallitalea pronyensis]QUI25333.1 DUF4489 domain-containing protein [Vallitalea pronyensis]
MINRDCKREKMHGSDKDCISCMPQHTKPKKILLECGEGTGSTTFTSINESPFQLAHITVDTTCLCKPEVVIKFTSLVCMDNLAEEIETGTVRLKYELFRACDQEEPVALGTWLYEQINALSIGFDTQEESFSFMFCESTSCHRCCEYFVVVTPLDITNATVTVSNGRMAALSQSMHDTLEKQHQVNTKDYLKKEKHPKPREILSVCGSGNGSASYRVPIAQPLPTGIAHASVDTTCLTKPKVFLEFACNIALISTFDLRLQFELFRVCDKGEPVSLGVWRFERVGGAFELGGEFIEKVFNFIFCEHKSPSSCCDYFVMLTANEITTEAVVFDVVVDNARLHVFAQDSWDYAEEDKAYSQKQDAIDCIPKHPKPSKAILECGSGVGNVTFNQSSTERTQIGQVSIDTTCLCKPAVYIEFSSNIGFELQSNELEALLQLQIELFKTCDNRGPVPIGVWVVEVFDVIEKGTGAFQFISCDCETCPGCCDYFVTATPIGAEASTTIITVSDIKIAALAQES